jgi:hypothetical protein
MNEKPKMSLRAARRDSRSDITPSAHPEHRAAVAGGRASADSARDFYDRQARTDAAVRTIPGLHNFGK